MPARSDDSGWSEQTRHGVPLPADLDPRPFARQRARHSSSAGGGRRRGALLASKIIVALLSCALLMGFGYGWWNYHDLNKNLNVIPIAQATVPGHKDIDGKDQNILIVGNDDRTNMTDAEVKELKVGRDGGSLATDTMMIVHVPANGKNATLISLPRDAYVDIPGYGMNRLNSAYASAYTHTSGTTDQKRGAGASLLEQTITNLTGLTIDSFVQVDLLGFVRISNAIKGVPINLCKAVDDTVAHNQSIGLSGGSGLVLSAGPHDIQGVTALEFVRQRENLPHGDIDRVARQRYFLTAAFRKITSAGTLLNPGKLRGLIQAVDKSLYVGGNFDLLKFAQQIAGLNANNIAGQTIPFVRFETVDVGSVEIIDPAQVKQFVANLLGTGQAILGSVAAADPSSVTVRVLNGGQSNGAAQTNAQRLTSYGFHASADTQGSTQAATTIQFADGMQAAAKALAAHLPKNVVLQKTDVTTLTLVLGADGLSVTAPTSASGTATTPTTSTAASKPLDAGCIN
jgi:LCP family protein required for cell wall assembly